MHPNPFGLAYSLSPVDLPEPLAPPPGALRWATTVIAVAALLLALLNAHALRSWAYQLPPGVWSERAVAAAETWYGAMDRLRLNAPVEGMHGRWEQLRARRLGSLPAAEPELRRGQG
ncbi:MAG TPA: hypothetical protein VGX37_02110 [Allosphingosinicella sp.]|nr:hypothetical protein [Allosphingosinicella sp.]